LPSVTIDRVWRIDDSRPATVIAVSAFFSRVTGSFVRLFFMERTPAQFRAIYNDWRKTAPANDSDIIPDKSRSESPRHAGMCADLKAMLAWREMKESGDPLQTNFMRAGMDDEIFDEDRTSTYPKRDVECEWEDRPTINEIMNALKGVIFKTQCDHAVMFWRGFTVWTERRVPDTEAMEKAGALKALVGYGEEYNSDVFPKSKLMSIVRLGDLRFSDARSHGRHPRGSLMYWNSGPWGQPANEPGTPNGTSENFFPPPEQRRLNPLERLIAMEDANAANDNLSPQHVKALDTALTARNFTVVGEAFGFQARTAERQGKRLVLEATKAFSAILERLAA
jgi:hypothetical protein